MEAVGKNKQEESSKSQNAGRLKYNKDLTPQKRDN